MCEVSPLVSYAGEDLQGQFIGTLELPYYLPSSQELAQFSAKFAFFAREIGTMDALFEACFATDGVLPLGAPRTCRPSASE